jgi:hypothetical protein
MVKEIFCHSENKKYLYSLSCLYIVFHILYVLNWGIFWDDWWLSSLSDSDLLDVFRQTGIQWIGYLHYLFRKSFSALLLYRISFFISGYVLILSLFYILQKEIIKNKYWSFWITAIFMVVPLNFPKITLICFPYMICLSLFYFAFAISTMVKNKISYRLLTLILFFFSFLTNSLILFYIIFLITLYWPLKTFKWRNNLNFIKSNVDFLLLPLVFVFFKYFIFPTPSGDYQGYNSLVVAKVGLYEPMVTFYLMIKYLLVHIYQPVALVISGILLVFAFLFRKKIESIDLTLSKNAFIKLLIYCFLAGLSAIIPYIVVGRSISQFGSEWLDRDTLLLPFAVSLFFVSLIVFVLSSQYLSMKVKSFLAFVLPFSLFILFAIPTLKTQILLLKDTIKQDAIISFMTSSSIVANKTTFAVEDLYPQLNIYNRVYRTYEFNGMAQKVFGNQQRLFVTTGELKDACPEMSKVGAICKDWIQSNIQSEIVIKSAENIKFYSKDIPKLMFLKFFNTEKYNIEIGRYFNISIH